MSLFTMDWDYFTLVNGRLIDDDGKDLNVNIRDFTSWDDANDYLVNEDIRGTLR